MDRRYFDVGLLSGRGLVRLDIGTLAHIVLILIHSRWVENYDENKILFYLNPFALAGRLRHLRENYDENDENNILF